MDDKRIKLEAICKDQNFPFPDVAVLMGVGGFLAEQPDLENLDLAEEAFRIILEMEAENTDALHNLGVTLIRKGMSKEAIPILEKAAKLAGDEPRTLVALGSALSNQDEYTEALIYFKRAAELSPGSEKVMMNLVTCLIKACEFDYAEKTLNEMLKADPLNVDAVERLEIVKKNRQQWEALIEIKNKIESGLEPIKEELESPFLSSLSLGRFDLAVYFLKHLGGELEVRRLGIVYSLKDDGTLKIEPTMDDM